MPGKHLTLEQRTVIAGLLSARGPSGRPLGVRVIARQVGVAHTTVARELRRDGVSRDTYVVFSAQLDADVKRRRPEPFRLLAATAAGALLRGEVAEGLGKNWSPRQVSGRLRRDYPGRPEMYMSHTAIYR